MCRYGFDHVTKSVEKATANFKAPTPLAVAELPNSTLAKSILNYATEELPLPVLNHSLRAYQYGEAILKDQSTEWAIDSDVLFSACLLHDIGTTEKNMNVTKMSFEYYGGVKARELVLKKTHGNVEFADAVCEAVIRHQDLGESGFITKLGLILQIVTVLDNLGKYTHLIHRKTLSAINKRYSREN
ncbi:uncharacterized protein LALA0_S22e00144g [Lachancea lanzarotensis]|uniref:LALA0S22e00144g1_1 n=1 Tax=Lachancea lanzarotensis TaxID=1245769 RepID=A0A0C7NLT4_9SACH|nr:uncharacterized protein LALA0_S22e00144g [Lachancea lanzarotensis]CEP67303.1 LALA0S22e00144g1_1 [Lachancea lanzarotensis]